MAIDFTTMDGYQFEDYISSLFRRLGFEVESTRHCLKNKNCTNLKK